MPEKPSDFPNLPLAVRFANSLGCRNAEPEPRPELQVFGPHALKCPNSVFFSGAAVKPIDFAKRRHRFPRDSASFRLVLTLHRLQTHRKKLSFLHAPPQNIKIFVESSSFWDHPRSAAIALGSSGGPLGSVWRDLGVLGCNFGGLGLTFGSNYFPSGLQSLTFGRNFNEMKA